MSRTIGIVLGATVAVMAGATALILATTATDTSATEGGEVPRVGAHREVSPPQVLPPTNVDPPRVAPPAPPLPPPPAPPPRKPDPRTLQILADLNATDDAGPSDFLGDIHAAAGDRSMGRGGMGSGGGRGGLIGTRAPSISHGPVVVRGGLDAALVRRYVRRISGRIQYCYERRLLAVPTLAGTTRLQFRIAAKGEVASASASGLDAEVDGCLATAIRSIEFPKPKGGSADVVYPITFKPA